ncbi:MAG: hypothetical protein M3X11_08605 [Acidobacteriota bacterium]|nr:hypothetical protein [Acidobacteriota bacterium]
MRRHLKPHEVRLAKDEGWADLANGKLLSAAQDSFDVVVTNDKSIRYQQRLSDYAIAIIVLRGISNKAEELVELMPDVLRVLETIQPGEVVYFYTAAAQKVENRRRRKRS